jgi:hypothetical protein
MSSLSNAATIQVPSLNGKDNKIRAVNIENLRKLKRALQKQKLKRIDSYRMQVGRCDYYKMPLPKLGGLP